MRVSSCAFLASMTILCSVSAFMWDDPVEVNDGSTIPNFPLFPIQLNQAGTVLINWPNNSAPNNFLFSSFSTDFGKTWSTPFQLTGPNQTYHLAGSGSAPFFSLNPQGRSALIWADDDQMSMPPRRYIKASLFDSANGGWNPPQPLASYDIPSGLDGNDFIRAAVTGSNNLSVVVWMQESPPDFFTLQSAYHEGNTNDDWTIQQIGTLNSNTTPVLSTSPSGEHIVVTWVEKSGNIDNLKMAFFNPSSHTWGNQLVISNQSVLQFAYPSINDSGTGVIAWLEAPLLQSDLSLGAATFTSSGRGVFLSVSPASSTEIFISPFALSLNAQTHAALCWQEQYMNSKTQKISYFDGTMWSPPSTFSTESTSAEGVAPTNAINDQDQIFLIYGENTALFGRYFQAPILSATPQMLDSSALLYFYAPISINASEALFSWYNKVGSNSSFSLRTAFCSGGLWTLYPVPNSDSPDAPGFAVYPTTSLVDGGAAVVAWGQQGSTNLFVSSHSNGPAPPTGGSGFQTCTKFLVPTDLINVLSWAPSPTPDVFYNIYRDGMFVGISNAPTFNDHQQIPKKSVTYSITAEDASGAQSAPLLFVVTP